MTTTPTEQNEELIYEPLVSWRDKNSLEEVVAKMNRRARRLKLPELALTEVGVEYHRKTTERPTGHPEEKSLPAGGWSHPHKYFRFRIEGRLPKVEGYQLVAVLDHETLPPIVNKTPFAIGNEIEINPKFRKRSPVCEHCDTARRRKETFLLLEEVTGKIIQVGRNCLADFIRDTSVSTLTFASEVLRALAPEEDVWEPSEGRSPLPMFPIGSFLRDAAMMITLFGFRSAGAAYDYQTTSTADDLRQFYFTKDPERRREMRKLINDKIEEFPKISESVKRHQEWMDRREAFQGNHPDLPLEESATAFEAENPAPETPWLRDGREALEWVSSMDPFDTALNDYEQNIASLASFGFVTVKNINLATSIVGTYLKKMEKLNQKRGVNDKVKERGWAVDGNGEFLHEPKKRFDFEARVLMVLPIDSFYGTRFLTKFRTKEGHTLVSFINDRVAEEGDIVKARGTVKEHETYRGENQTKLIRVQAEVTEEFAFRADS